ncbi:MAG: START domain-containing protein [Thermodesulfobacteriota bacterium]
MDQELLYEKDGIRAYQKSFPGTDVREFSATGFVDAPMEVLGEVIVDVPRYPNWMADVSEARVVQDIDRHTKVIYCRLKLPWPISDRDFVIRNQTVIDLETARCIINFAAVDDRSVAPAKKCVRMTDLTGSYKLEYLGADKTLVTFTQKAHPGGNTPPAMANVQSQHYPYKDIKGLRRMVREKVYWERGRVSEDRKIIEEALSDPNRAVLVMKNRFLEYAGDKKVVDKLFASDPEIAAAITGRELTYDAIRTQVARSIEKLFEMGAADKVIKDAALRKRLKSDKALLNRMLKDDKLTFSLLENKQGLEKTLADYLAA